MIAIECQNVSKTYRLGQGPANTRLSELLGWGARRMTRRLLGGSQDSPKAKVEEFYAVRDVSLQIGAGEVVGLIGRNGAGKSTLLKLISWVTAPTSGRVGLRGRLSCLLEVGTGFHFELTGRENVFLNGAILGMTRREIRAKFDQIVSFAEVEDFLDTQVKHYSSGMFVRLAFAVAALLEPEILIVDEVLSVGDAAFQKKSMGVMQDLVHRGCTCLIVSHNMSAITNLCRRAILLQSGRVIADGHPVEVVQQYLAAIRSQRGAVVWDNAATAPGSPAARLRSVRVLQGGADDAVSDIDITRDFEIELIYENGASGQDLYCGLTLRDQVGTVVLVTSPTRPDARDVHSLGTFRAVCRFPGSFLNEGRFTVSAVVGRGINETLAYAEDVVAFDVHDTGEMRGHYFGHWPGVVRPKLPWTTTPISM
jgi:lipopolysaccharide transport system ATP-binding protein